MICIVIILAPMTAVLIGVTLLAAVHLTAGAQDVATTATVATYLNGGVGDDEQAAMRCRAKEFPLRMTFSEGKGGKYIADVSVVVTDAHGNSVFELSTAGLMLDAALPDGNCKVNASFKGLTESKAVTLAGMAGKDLQFSWK